MTELPQSLIKMPSPHEHRRWAELTGDSAIESLRLALLGYVHKRGERIRGTTWWTAICVLVEGQGTYRFANTPAPVPVEGPGLFFTSPHINGNYGPVRGCRWIEFYFDLEGSRIAEWQKAGWWPLKAQYFPLSADQLQSIWDLFVRAVGSLEHRDRASIDSVKLDLERWLHDFSRTRAAEPGADVSPLTSLVDAWRTDPERVWSLRQCASDLNMSYTRFRALFTLEYGTSPYDFLLKLRLERSCRWLSGTDNPVKFVAARSGFKRTETFNRAFRGAFGLTPTRWREKERERLIAEREAAAFSDST